MVQISALSRGSAKLFQRCSAENSLKGVALTNAVRGVCQWTSRNNGIAVTEKRGACQWHPVVSAIRWFSTEFIARVPVADYDKC
jgi:hypothetical protein